MYRYVHPRTFDSILGMAAAAAANAAATPAAAAFAASAAASAIAATAATAAAADAPAAVASTSVAAAILTPWTHYPHAMPHMLCPAGNALMPGMHDLPR